MADGNDCSFPVRDYARIAAFMLPFVTQLRAETQSWWVAEVAERVIEDHDEIEGVALATEDRKRLGIFRQMTVRENMTISALSQFSDAGVISGHREQRAVQQQTDSLGIRTAGSEAMITSLSGGNQQKCMLARCLLTKPEVLLLDDPTRGVDVGAKSEIYRLMDQLSEQGVSMIVTSGELPELLAVCDRILVLSEGHLTGRFSATEATEQLIMEAATAGRDGLQLSP